MYGHITSGIICDGAKARCAAKIASAVDAGLLGLAMYENGNQFFGGEGIVKKRCGKCHPHRGPAPAFRDAANG